MELYELLIPILTFLSVALIGAAVLIARGAKREAIMMRLEQFDAPDASARPNTEDDSFLLRLMQHIGSILTPDNQVISLRRHLAHAGFFSPNAIPVYIGFKTLAVLMGLVGCALLVMPMNLMMPLKVMIIVGGAWTVSLLPSLIVDIRRNVRSTDVRMYLPDAVDLLEICVSAGMGLDMAWNAVADEIRRVSRVLADEMALTNLEIHLGANRATAMRHMAERTGSDDLSSLVGVLVQSERFGTPISDALRTFAESMRESRSARAAESAEKLGVKMLIPMILFILPAILIVMGGGAFIKIYTLFKTM